MTAFLALLHKDWRVVKPAVLTALLFLAMPVLIFSARAAVGGSQWEGYWPPGALDTQLRNEAVYWIILGAMLASLVTPAIGGSIIARERRDRSADFMELLPLPRPLRVFAKLVLLVFIFALLVLTAAALRGVVGLVWSGHNPNVVPEFTHSEAMPVVVLAMSLCGLCVGWFYSSFLRSEIVASVAAFGSILFVALLLFVLPGGTRRTFFAHLASWRVLNMSEPALAITLLTGGATLGVIMGTVIAIRRREP